MSQFSRYLAGFAIIIGLTPGIALASGDPGSPASTFTKVFLDSERCSVLMDQFHRVASGRTIDKPAAEAAAQGIDLCHGGDFADGADTLSSAVQMIGETPAHPPPRVPLR